MRIEPFKHQVKVVVEAVVNPSEDVEKVKRAIRNITLGVEPQLTGGRVLRGESEDQKSLYTIYEQIRARRTMAVARRMLTQNSTDNHTWLYLNKQAAYMNVVAICEEEGESPLGPIKLEIYTDNLAELIDWLSPS